MVEGNGEVRELPEEWCWVQHKDIAQINPKLPLNELADNLIVSFLPMAAVEEKSGRYRLSEIREYGKVKKGYTPFINGDLIFAKITPCMENGKVAVLENLQNGMGCGSTEFHVSRLTSLTSRKYLFYYLVQERFRRDARQHMTGSAGQLRVSKSYFEEVQIPLAPLFEQKRIVEKIEELFSDVDQGVESLKTAQKQLKVYRQAVLKWAFEGKLTEAWRSQQPTLQTGEALLAQIKAERENRYQQKLAEWEEKVGEWGAIGKVGKKPSKPQQPKELTPLAEADISELPQFPNDWRLEKLGNLSELVGGVTKGRDLKGQETISLPYLRVANVQDGYLDLSIIKYINVLPTELDKYQLLAGDVLYTEGGDKDKLGRGTVWKEEIKNCIHQNHVFRARLLSISIIPSFIAYYSQTRIAKDYFFKRAKQTVNLASINMTILSNFPIPIPSYREQEQIVEEIESRLSICDQLEATIIENLQKAEALRQSILKQAFEGKLVPQDPNDEPAEKLLERIRAERQEKEPQKTSKPLR